MSEGLMRCPFCVEENSEQATVCRACRRDIAIPLSLTLEHRELSLKREQLRAELHRINAKLRSGDRRLWVW